MPDGSGVAVGVRCGVAVGDKEVVPRGVTVADRVGVHVGNSGVEEGEPAAEGVAEGERVGLVERLAVGLGGGVRVAVAVGRRVFEAVAVGLAVRDRDAVGDTAYVATAVGVPVGVSNTGTPTLTRSHPGGPTRPATSLTRTMNNVSPCGNAREELMGIQYCTVAALPETNRGRPNSSSVQARRTLGLTVAPQAQSSKTGRKTGPSSKTGRATPGTPPSQMLALPSPTFRVAWIKISGPDSGGGAARGTRRPTADPHGPGAASTTS